MKRERQFDDMMIKTGGTNGSMWLATALLAGAALGVFASSAHAGLYKWVDDQGVVHYSDRIPVDAVNRAKIELNHQGVTVGRIERAVTPVARPATVSDADRQREAERDKLIAERRDRALIESYANESEIDLAKTRAVSTIDGQVESAQGFIAQMSKRRRELEASMASYAPLPVPASIKQEIAAIDADVARQNDFIASKKKESTATAARYDADKRRFHELRTGEPTSAVARSDSDAAASAEPPRVHLASRAPAPVR